jgi:hypothetical protein
MSLYKRRMRIFGLIVLATFGLMGFGPALLSKIGLVTSKDIFPPFFRTAVLGLGFGVALVCRYRLSRSLQRSGRIPCRKCGYDLRGIEGDPITCPECGKVLDPDEPLL